MTWEKIKELGSDHYKTGEIEPIDLFKAGGILHDFSVGNIIKYAYRNRKRLVGDKISRKDMIKIKHYSEILGEISNEDG